MRARGRAVGVLGSPRATNEENYLLARLARGGLGSGDLDSCLRSTYLPLARGVARGSGGGATRGSLEEIEQSEVIILFEGDLARTHPRAAFAIMRAVARGARLVTVSCVRTQLARIATMRLRVAPGEQGELVAGLVAGVVEARGAVVELEGWNGAPPLGDSADEVLAAGRWYAEAEKASLVIAPECIVGHSAEALGEALGLLSKLSGQLDRSGSVVLPLPVRWNLRGACEMGVAPDVLPGGESLGDALALSRLTQAWGRTPSAVSGRDAAAMISEVGGLLVMTDDPLSVLRDGRGARERMAELDCLVVLDAFMTPSVEAAHVVLPVASHAELDGTCTSADGRVQRVRPCVRPPGSARPGWQVLAELSARLGLPPRFSSAAEVLSEIRRVVPAYEGLDGEALDQGWGDVVASPGDGLPVEASRRSYEAPRDCGNGSHLLAVDGVFDWGSDPLVAFSPTLSRDSISTRKLFAGGLVELNSEDASELGLRPGWPVQIKSLHGEITLPVVVRRDLERGLSLVPFMFLDSVYDVLAGGDVVAVQLTRPAG